MLNVNIERCTACGACMNACPKSCISMFQQEDGFVIPSIDIDECIGCNVCEKVCPIGKNHDFKYKTKAYASVIKNTNKLMLSTSGGAFSAIADYVLDREGIVYGCAYNKDLKPIHIRVDSIEKLKLLNGSKYVQSDIRFTFRQAKKDLDNGLLVLYSGTPCQIAGLKSFLKKEYDNLLTTDIICHGVPSYLYFKKYIDWLERKENIRIKKFDFRSKKSKNWGLSGIYSGISNKTGKIVKKQLHYYDSYYYYYFLKGDIYRESCYSCEYANMKRQGDFTIGDFWGAEAANLNFDISNGCSLILLNSEKSKKIFNDLNIISEPIIVEEAIAHNRQLEKPSEKSECRTRLLEQFMYWETEKIDEFFRKSNFKSRLITKIKYSIPIPVRKYILKIKYNYR